MCYHGEYFYEGVKKKATLDVEVFSLADYIAAEDLMVLAAKNLKKHLDTSDKEAFKKFWSEELPDVAWRVEPVLRACAAGMEGTAVMIGVAVVMDPRRYIVDKILAQVRLTGLLHHQT